MESNLILGRRYPGGRGGYLGHDQVAINIASRRRTIDESWDDPFTVRPACVKTDSFCTNTTPLRAGEERERASPLSLSQP